MNASNLVFKIALSSLGFIASISCVLTLLSFLGHYYWLVDLGSHFRLVYLWIQFLFIVMLLLKVIFYKSQKSINGYFLSFLIIGTILNAWQIMPIFFKPASPEVISAEKLKILHMNVLGTNRNYTFARNLIHEVNPDILVLAEYNSRWRYALENNGDLKRFPYQYVVKYGNDGLYSKFPLKSAQVEYMSPGKDPTTVVHFLLNKEPVTLLMVHPRPPVKPHWYARHKRQFAKWEKDYARYGENVLIVGDLNTSPWSATFQHLLAVTGLRDSQMGFGVQPSWPVSIPKGNIKLTLLPMIPIDHVLVSERFVVLERKLGPNVGSDHLPVIVELGLTPDTPR